MVDKDIKEVDVLRESFPNATLLLCHFHVLKYLRAIVKYSNFGRYSRYEYESMEHVFPILYSRIQKVNSKYKRNSSRKLHVPVEIPRFGSTFRRTG
ncbi:hypothetical protein JG688_00014171 [Phytophthora aleatoria]|uniref:MULE transposase domain-containing protein n=1 Tax=Phytophthora aleatoria TaxID=2496075 RepID=A0A8J5ME42_9STRA|nr:hypothetical protein JG688_00014171 [Phytophthora aleatoria]